MSYYDTIDEDLQRAREILARGAAVPGHGGFIAGLDVPAAYWLLESFVAEIERLRGVQIVEVRTPDGGPVAAPCCVSGCQYADIERLQEDLVELAVTSHRTEQRLRAEVSSPASQLSISEADALIEGLKDVAAGRIVPVPAAEVSSPASQLKKLVDALVNQGTTCSMFNPQTCDQKFPNYPRAWCAQCIVKALAEVSSPASQLDLELRAIAGHLCNMEKEFPSTCKAIRQCIARLEPHDD